MHKLLALVLMSAGVLHAAPADSDGWITHPEAGTRTPIVLEFRRELPLQSVPSTFPVTISADNRFVLYVNGARAASGPSAGTVQSWRYSTVDLAPHLKRGANVITAVVWNFGEVAPLFQQMVATGFRMQGDGLSSGTPGWQVRIDQSRSALDGKQQITWQYYVASAPEVIDARIPQEPWVDAVPAPSAAARTLIADPLPPQLFVSAAPGSVVRSSDHSRPSFPGKPLVVDANTTVKLLLRRDAMISAYPELEVQGGRDAVIRMQYGEALYDAEGRKADRNLIEGRQLRGFFDTFIADGSRRVFAPLWWRTFRFIEIEVQAKDEPLTLHALRLNETGYPFEQLASFESSDAQLDRIWNIGWRTMRVDAHETFMDSSYWEQLQYTGDTRIEMLLTYAVSGDARLGRQAIEAFAQSDVDGGFMQGAYPSRGDNVIATFALAWVGMLADWYQEQPDEPLVTRHLPRMRQVLARFERPMNKQGLLGKNAHWNFIDWSGQQWDDRDAFPHWGSQNGSCLLTAMWTGALRQGVVLERRLGDAARAMEYQVKADKARAAIREHCWDASRGLFADEADHKVFSQHMNVFAVLYDIATPEEALPILERVTVKGAGIDAPAGMYGPTYYFAWYLVRAFEHVGQAARYHDLLQSWRELLPLNFTTWPESRGQTRSDSHAWSAHPTADLLRIVAGIRAAAPGYARVNIAPQLGNLTSLEASAATPHGLVKVSYRVTRGKLTALIDRPAALPGEFVWRGQSYPLEKTRTRLELAN